MEKLSGLSIKGGGYPPIPLRKKTFFLGPKTLFFAFFYAFLALFGPLYRLFGPFLTYDKDKQKVTPPRGFSAPAPWKVPPPRGIPDECPRLVAYIWRGHFG